MRNIWNIVLVVSIVFFGACSSDETTEKPAPQFKSSTPKDGDTDVRLSTDFKVVFDEVIVLSPNHEIKVNNQLAEAEVKGSSTELLINVELSYATTYEVIIPAGSVINTSNVPLANDVRFSFTTEEEPVISPSMAVVAKMGVGWNLGNTLDTKNADETAWGNPKATKELIDAIKNRGFKTLRVPVTWQYHMGEAPDYIIEEAWLDRVEEVVNYGLDNDMYVIINIHHDEEWVIPSYDKLNASKNQLGIVWTQIANRFKEYNDHLIFETLNETRLLGSPQEWTGGTAEGRDCINQFHQVSVEAIRSTGSNNADRHIMVSTYAASAAEAALNDLVLPSSSNLIVSIHNYFPYNLSLGKTETKWGTNSDKSALDFELDRLVEKFISRGIPVVMGEWGTQEQGNLEDRVRHAAYFAKGCVERGICPVWWDNGISNGEFGIINRNTYEWVYPDIAAALVSATAK